MQKHKRSSAHETRVEMTQAFGIPTSDNPRPYGCPECDTAFRKHGHLAKHLRSKSHITKLEANGLIPVGTYAALEKSGQELKDKLVTTNCEQSLHSLRKIAMQLFQHQTDILSSIPSPEHMMMNSNNPALTCISTATPPPSSSSGPTMDMSGSCDESVPPHMMMSMMSPHQVQPHSLDYSLQMPISTSSMSIQQAPILSQANSVDNHIMPTHRHNHHSHHHQHLQQSHLPIQSPSNNHPNLEMDYPLHNQTRISPIMNCGGFVPTTTTMPLSVVSGSHSPSTNQLIMSPPPPQLTQQPPLLNTPPQASVNINQQVMNSNFLPVHPSQQHQQSPTSSQYQQLKQPHYIAPSISNASSASSSYHHVTSSLQYQMTPDATMPFKMSPQYNSGCRAATMHRSDIL